MEKVESDGTRLEVTLLEVPWRKGKTERAGKDWKEDCYNTRPPEAQTWTDFEEDCDAVNKARASKINDGEYSAYQRVFGRNPHRWKMPFWSAVGVVSRQQAGELAQERSTTMRPSKFSLGPQTSLETSPPPRCETQQLRTARWTTPVVLELWHPGVVISNTLATVWIACRGSVVECARSQVRPFHDDDEAAHEHVTEHVRDLGERQLHEGDFSYEDITGQDEPPVDSPPAQGENTATGPPGPDGEGQTDVDPEARRRMRGKTRPTSLEQTTVSPVNASSDATPQKAERDHDDKRRRIDEPVSPVSTVAQDEVSTLSPVSFDSETRDDEIVVDVPLPEEPGEMSGENRAGSQKKRSSQSRLVRDKCDSARK